MTRNSWAALFLVAAIAAPAAADIDTTWTRTFGGAGNDGFRALVKTADGGFLAAGYTCSSGAGDVDLWVVKTDGAGNELWSRTYGGAGRDYGYGACAVAAAGYAVTGYTTSFGAGREDLWLVRLDEWGDTPWTRTFGGAANDEGRTVCETPDGAFLVAGQTESFGAGEKDWYILKIDAAGDTLWTRVYGDLTDSYGAGGYDGWLVRYRDAATGVEEPVGAGSRAFLSPPAPNPARGGLSFALQLPEAGSVDLRVLNVAGEEIRALHRGGDLAPGLHRFGWDGRCGNGRPVSSGVYFIVAGGAVRDMRRAVIVR